MKSFHRSILSGALVRGALSLPFMMMGTPGAHAETVIGAEGAAGANCFPNGEGCAGGNGGDGESVFASGNPAMAIGGSGGGVGGGDEDDEDGNGGAGGSAAALATGSSGNANVTVSASAQGGDGSGSGESPLGGAGGDADASSVATSSGPGVASSSASATGGWGSFGRNAGRAGGDANASSVATSSGPGVASSSASATGGAGGGSELGERTYGADGDASASSGATSSGSGGASSSATATGRSFLSLDGGNASARANASAIGRGTALAKAVATGGNFEITSTANATSNAETASGALAQAQSTALGSSGQAQSTAKTSFAGMSVQSSAVAPTRGGTATTNAIAQGGAGQDFVNPGQTAYAFSTALPDKAYATTLIDGASHVASALLEPRDAVFGTAILGANYASDGFGESDTTSASSTFDFGYGGDLQIGLIDDQVSGFAKGVGFQSMEFTIQADGVEVLDVTFGSLAIAESFFRDDVIDLGADLGSNIDLTFGYTLTADGPGGFGFDLAIGGAVPETSTWAMMVVGFAGLGFAGHRSTKRRAAVRPRA
jgi:hypothetical protein